MKARRAKPLLLLLAGAFALVPSSARADTAPATYPTVWDRIMQDQSAINLRRGYALMGEQDYGAAADEFFKAAQKDPSSPWPRLLYGSALYWLGEPDKALDEFEAALKLDPNNSMALQLRGIVRARAGRYEDALSDFLAAEKLSPERPDVKMNAGSVYQALGRHDKALDYFRAAVSADPDNPLYRYQLGLFYSRSGRNREAAGQLEKAVSLFSGYEDALLELAVLREREGRLPEAVRLYRRALKIKPRDSVARFRLAWALYKSGRREEALQGIEEAFRLAPANDKGGISMTMAYSGRPPAAAGKQEPQSPLASALSRIPPNQEARAVVELLQSPKASLQPAADGEKLAGRLKSAFRMPKVSYTKREYFLPAASAEEREKRVAEISAEADSLFKAAAASGDTRLNFNIDTSAPPVEEKKPEAQALYRPRDVGNDMGLWVMGDNWLDNASEAVDEIEASGEKGPGPRLIQGVGYLLLGEPSQALEQFSGGGSRAALGRSAAWVEAGDPAKALSECLEALRIDPNNRTALANKAWLGGK
ncbi:MAG: tetratricopeptide repeat protein [Elusimicrobia bacterium]|nr:tetratricopeptide repeat protein [Elusimicrobiota bacterium]